MIKSDETCQSFSSSTTPDTFTENNKSRETVSKLFSKLFQNSEATCNTTNSKNFLSAATVAPPADLLQPSKKNSISKSEITNEGKTRNELCDLNKTVLTPISDKDTFKENPSLALFDTVILDRNKTPLNSKIPVTNSRTDDPPNSCEAESKNSGSAKFENSRNLRRACSTSKIPISTRRLYAESQACLLPSTERYYSSFSTNKEPLQKRTEKVGTGKYNHIKSKVAAYIRRPMKTECVLRSNRSMSPIYSKIRNDNLCSSMSGIKRMNSRTSIDTYTCDYKTLSTDVSIDYDKCENSSESHQKIRRHVELALEHNRRKLEKERIIAEHQCIIAKQHQQVIEYSEKANDCLQKAAALLLNRIAEKS